MPETSKHDPGWWQHCLGATGMGLIILVLYYFHVSDIWAWSILGTLSWPLREFGQNGLGFLYGRSLAEWLPASLIVVAFDILGASLWPVS